MFEQTDLANWPEYSKIFIGMYARVTAPIVIPQFLALMSGRSGREMKTVALVGSVGFLVVTVLFTFLGDIILGAFGISMPAFRLAGGFLMLLIAVDMIRSSPSDNAAAANTSSSALALGIVPLAIPFLAGPGSISAIVIFANMHEGPDHKMLTALVLVTVAIVIWLQLRLASIAARFFTPNMALISNKIMGLIIAAIAFEFIMDGIAGHFPALETIH
jgi:multiple antibiotic resistance protein